MNNSDVTDEAVDLHLSDLQQNWDSRVPHHHSFVFDGRAIRRTAERKRRIESKKQRSDPANKTTAKKPQGFVK